GKGTTVYRGLVGSASAARRRRQPGAPGCRRRGRKLPLGASATIRGGSVPRRGKPRRAELRFDQIGLCAALKKNALVRVLRRVVRGEEKHYRGLASAAGDDPPAGFESVDAGQMYVHQHQVRFLVTRSVDRSFAQHDKARG